jgi:hypothetical protein
LVIPCCMGRSKFWYSNYYPSFLWCATKWELALVCKKRNDFFHGYSHEICTRQ